VRAGAPGCCGGGAVLLLAPLLLLPAVGDAARPGLRVADVAQVQPDGARGEGVGGVAVDDGGLLRLRLRLRRRPDRPTPTRAVTLLEGGAEAADERVEAAPRLAQRALARRRGHQRRAAAAASVRRAERRVDARLAEAVEVAQELEHVRAAAAAQLQRRAVRGQVPRECVPVPPLLRLVPARPPRRRPRARASATARRHVLYVSGEEGKS